MDFSIIDYSDKAIAVCGDTKEFKDQLKKLGGRFNFRLSCGAGWIFPKTKREQIEALLNGENVATKVVTKATKRKGLADDIKADLTAYFQKVWGKDTHMIDYCVGEIAHAARLSNGLILTIKKPEIETRFCFGESGYDYNEAAHMAYNVARTEDYFKGANLRGFNTMIDNLKKAREVDEWGHKKMHIYIYVPSYSGCPDRVICKAYASESVTNWAKERGYEEMDDADIDTAIALYEEARDAFKKRLDAYWKRYGSSKLRTWTYWRDA